MGNQSVSTPNFFKKIRTLVTDSGAASEKVRLSKKQLETAFDTLADSICIIDIEYTIVRINRSYSKLAQKTIPEVLGGKCFQVFWHSDRPCPHCPAHNTILTKEPCKRELTRKDAEGEERHFDIQTLPVCDEQGRLVSVIEHIRDVTEEKSINQQLMRSEKLASIGIMTAGIAHEMNNPLSGISGIALNLLSRPEKYGLNEKGRDRIAMVLECASRATMIINDLLRFSDKQENIRIPTDIRMLLHKAVKSARKPGLRGITVQFDIQDGIPPVRCDPSKMEQAVANVAVNGFWALSKRKKEAFAAGEEFSGVLTVQATKIHDEVAIEIADNGVGIMPGAESKIFDPFFTTSSPGKGAGLGLSICHRIIEEHQGSIDACSKNGITTIRMVLPIGKDPLADAQNRIVTRRKKKGHVQSARG